MKWLWGELIGGPYLNTENQPALQRGAKLNKLQYQSMDKLYNVFAPKLKVLKDATKQLANSTKELASQINKNVKKPFDLIEITPRLFWMDFPSPHLIEGFSRYLNAEYHNHYYIWNVGEKQFATEWFGNQVASHSHAGYPCPPLIELFTICKNILYFLGSDPLNVAVICCQETRGRSIMVISSLLSIMGAGHPGECLVKVCELTNTQDFKALFPSQHLYINYVGNLMSGLKLSSSCLRLVSIVLNGIPKVPNCPQFKPYVQLFKNEKLVFNSLTECGVKAYTQEDQSCIFDVKGVEVILADIKLSDDILVRCKHFENNTTRVAMFRMMFNCSFLFDNVFRVWERDLDKSPQLKVEKEFFVDFIFERGNQKSFQTADRPQQFSSATKNSNQLILQIVQDCKGLVMREKQVSQGIAEKFNPAPQNIHKDDIFSIGAESESKTKEDTQDWYKDPLYSSLSQEASPVNQSAASQLKQQQQLSVQAPVQQQQLQKQEQQQESRQQQQQNTQFQIKGETESQGADEEKNRLSAELKKHLEDIQPEEPDYKEPNSEQNKIMSQILQKSDGESDDEEELDKFISQLEQGQ